MDDTAATLLKHRDRVHEIAAVLVRHGLATWAARGSDLAGVGPVDRLVRRVVTPEELQATDGQRLRGALTELGTTFIKFSSTSSRR